VRLLFLIRSLDMGGAEMQIVNLAVAAKNRGHDTAIAVFYGGGPLEAHLENTGVQLFNLAKAGRWDIIGFLIRFVRVLKKYRPAVLYSSLEGANVVAALSKPLLGRTRLVWRIASAELDISGLGWIPRLGYSLEDWLSRIPDVVVVNSRSGRDWVIRRGFPAQRLCRVPNGIDTGRFGVRPTAGKKMRQELGIPDSVPVVGIAGRIDPVKRHDVFLRAAAQVADVFPDVRLLCVGSGDPELQGNLEKLAKALGLFQRVIWTGFRKDTERMYNAIDVLCSSSDTEGFPNVVAEAMACGVPAVVTDVGDSAEVVGSCGLVVSRRDQAGLATALIAMLNRQASERDSLRNCCRQRIVTEYSMERCVDRYIEVGRTANTGLGQGL